MVCEFHLGSGSRQAWATCKWKIRSPMPTSYTIVVEALMSPSVSLVKETGSTSIRVRLRIGIELRRGLRRMVSVMDTGANSIELRVGVRVRFTLRFVLMVTRLRLLLKLRRTLSVRATQA